MEGPEKIAAVAEELAKNVGERTLSAPVSYFRILKKMIEIANEDTIAISKNELREHLTGEAATSEEDFTFALRFWSRLGRCIWVEDEPELPVVVDVERASKIFGHVICSGDQKTLDDLGIPLSYN